MKTKKLSLSVQERATQLVEKWYILDPLYFIIWTTHRFVPNPTIRTIRTGNGCIEYNMEFMNHLLNVDFEAILKAELLRILLKHPYSRRQPHADIMYMASNITLKEHAETTLNFPTAAAFFKTKDCNKKHFEWYYHQILNNTLPAQSADNQSNTNNSDSEKPSNQGDSDSNNSSNQGDSDSNNHSNTSPQQSSNQKNNNAPPTSSETTQALETAAQENAALWDTNDWLSNVINEKIENAMQKQAWGTIRGSLQELIKASLRPKLDYRHVLRAFRQTVLSSKRTLTRMKPSRRYEFEYMGSRRDFTTKLLFAFDVSGSVSNRDLNNALSALNQFFKYGIETIDVIQFDTEIQGKAVSIKKAQSTLKVIGRGGTDFQPVLSYLDEHRDYDGLILFTDGYAPVPVLKQPTKTKILWLFNNESNYNQMANPLKKIGKAAFLH
jgi:predicted metal-dependent peptidase